MNLLGFLTTTTTHEASSVGKKKSSIVFVRFRFNVDISRHADIHT